MYFVLWRTCDCLEPASSIYLHHWLLLGVEDTELAQQ